MTGARSAASLGVQPCIVKYALRRSGPGLETDTEGKPGYRSWRRCIRNVAGRGPLNAAIIHHGVVYSGRRHGRVYNLAIVGVL